MMLSYRPLAGLLLVVLAAGGLGAALWREGDTAAAVRGSAEAFLKTLSEEQRRQTVLPYDSPKRVDWHFIPKGERKGLQLREMNEEQRKAALQLLRSTLSQVGYDKATAIMQLERLLDALEQGRANRNIRDPERYYFTLFGAPGGEAPWGLSIEGHHFSANFAFAGGRVTSSTPTVYCTNPAIVMKEVEGLSIPRGTRILEQEETVAFELFGQLNEAQRRTAVIAKEAPAEVRAAGEAHPPQAAPEGIAASDLSREQRALLRKLIEVYARNWPSDLAERRLAEIEEAGWEKVHFAWAGADKPGIGHYYRVQGPTFLIELVNVQPDVAGNPANHVHSLWRDVRGDFALPIAGK